MNISEIERFIMAGRAEFTFRSVATGVHFTYKVKAPEKDDGVRFVHFLHSGSSFSYLGMIKHRSFDITQKSAVGRRAAVFKAFSFLYDHVRIGTELPPSVEFLPSGNCAKCGRKLTNPDSIFVGIGPECILNLT